MSKKKFAVYLCIWAILLFLLASLAGSDMPNVIGKQNDIVVKAKITAITHREKASLEDENALFHQGVNIEFSAKILSGSNRGKIVSGLQNIDESNPYNIQEVKKGDKVLLSFFSDENMGSYWLMTEFIRTDFLMLLALIFAVCVIFFGRFKGVTTIASLVLTCLCIFKVLIPSILSGKNIYVWSVIVCLYIILMTETLISENRKKCITASLGCIAGSFTVGILTFISDLFLNLTGVLNEESMYLKYVIEGQEIDLKAIIFASILIGAVGAIMDVSISISSSLYELSQKAADNSFKSLMSSGMAIGRDIMGTMANTLVLAYIGSSMALTILLFAYSDNYIALFNREILVVEVLNAIVGSFALLLTIPLTSFISSASFSGGLRGVALYLIGEEKEKE